MTFFPSFCWQFDFITESGDSFAMKMAAVFSCQERKHAEKTLLLFEQTLDTFWFYLCILFVLFLHFIFVIANHCHLI